MTHGDELGLRPGRAATLRLESRRLAELFSEKLGFTVALRYGEPAVLRTSEARGARLNLRFIDVPVIDPAQRERAQLLSATIALDDAGALFGEYEAAGVDIAQRLRTEPWGAQTFILRDLDGNLILFAGAQ